MADGDDGPQQTSAYDVGTRRAAGDVGEACRTQRESSVQLAGLCNSHILNNWWATGIQELHTSNLHLGLSSLFSAVNFFLMKLTFHDDLRQSVGFVLCVVESGRQLRPVAADPLSQARRVGGDGE